MGGEGAFVSGERIGSDGGGKASGEWGVREAGSGEREASGERRAGGEA